MKIAHIFNEVKPRGKTKDKFIDTQPFEINYFNNYTFNGYEDLVLENNDFSKKYYHALAPIENKEIISKYDNNKLNRLIKKLGNNLLLISGDFWGIQKFIFDGVTTSKASKILRSRSAMVQLITYAVVDRVIKEFDGSEALLFGAGKFMILAKDEHKEKLENIQKELDNYFLHNFFGQNGFILSSISITSNELKYQKEITSMEDYENFLDKLGKVNDLKKLNKFDLLNVEDNDICIDLFKGRDIDDRNSCKFCNKRIIDNDKEACKICFYQIELGKKLTTSRYISIFSSNKIEKSIEIIKLGDIYYYASFSNDANSLNEKIFDISSDKYFDYPKWSLNSYVPTENDEIKDFSIMAKYSSGLMALKADIDKLGDTFRTFYKEDFKKFNRLSREVEFFFSDYITSLVARRDNIYTVFAGGDDLFLIGEYREIVDLAKEIREEFYSFSLNKTTISMGLVMFKPTTPINFVSEMADKAEKRAKIERDSIDIFGVSMKFDEFIEIENSFNRVVRYLKDNGVETTIFYYRLIELCDMRENIEKNVRNALWKSKLNYLFIRNIKKENNDIKIFNLLNTLIEKGEKFKPSLFLKIYQNRDKKKENRND